MAALTEVVGLARIASHHNDALWRDADLPDAERAAWQKLMLYRTRLPDDAVMLARHGWHPDQVRAARFDSTVYWPNRAAADPTVTRAEAVTAALAALANETAKYHRSQARLAREVRAQYILDLAQRLPAGTRWSHKRVAQLLGLTRHRIGKIVKRKSM